MAKPKRQRCVMVMYDTLCRHFLPTYGNQWIKAPNFERLAQHTTQFDNFYVGSMPCMPARREMHTGRYNFLHRSWGPLEPFDDSMPEILQRNGVHSHKATDHYHYWEDGGATYHQRYSSYDLVRGQEGDKWVGDVAKLRDASYGQDKWPETQRSPKLKQDNINREHMTRASKQPQHQTFDLGLEFIARNQDADRWFLQIETFDPHEPFFSQPEFHALYPHEYNGPDFDWPPYREVREDDQTIAHIRYVYAALISYCDQQLGRVLDAFDQYNLWEDTMLVVNTDHGFLMGEHDWWAKVVTPFFQEVAHIPFWIYDPRQPDKVNQTRDALIQTVDLPPTLLEYFDIEPTVDMQGHQISPLLEQEASVREAALFGVMGGQVNVTDGRYVYMRGNQTADNQPLFDYTLMPTHMSSMFSPQELQHWEKVSGFSFMKGCEVMQIPTRTHKVLLSEDTPMGRGRTATLLFDVVQDPAQLQPLLDEKLEMRMIRLLLREMARNECPSEQYERLGLPEPTRLGAGHEDEQLKLPNDAAIQQACVLQTTSGELAAEQGGNGFPKLPFHPAHAKDFPDNLRLRPGYQFSQNKP
jgi:arylsulfatase A-like enzyme